MSEQIKPKQFHETDGVEDWRVLGEGACAYFRTGSFATGARLVDAISELAGLDAHHPDVDVRYEGVTVRLITITDDYFGQSERDVELARQISAVARELGASPEPTMLQTIQVAIDALVRPEVMPFLRAVLGYLDRGDGDEDLLDPLGRGPAFWFQQMDAPRPQRNRIHLDVWVPAARPGRGARRRRARGRRPSGDRRLRPVVVGPGRRRGQRGGRVHMAGPRLSYVRIARTACTNGRWRTAFGHTTRSTPPNA